MLRPLSRSMSYGSPAPYRGRGGGGRSYGRNKALTLLDSVWAQIAVLLMGCGLGFWLNLGGYPLFDVDEPRYAQAAYEMIQRNDWVTPYFNGVVRFDKPVFYYWLIAFAYQLMGVTEFAARSVSALSGTLMVFATYGVAARMIGARYGFIAGLVLLSSIMMMALSRMSITDMTLVLWMTLTTLTLFLVAQHSRRWWLLAGLFAGIGILTKGPVAIVLPGAVLTVYAFVMGQWKQCFLTPWFFVAVVMALLVPVPWYWAAYQANGQVFLDALYHHNVSRFSGAVNYHIKPFWYYIPVLLVGFMPWITFLPAAIRTATRWCFMHWPSRRKNAMVSMLVFSAVWAVTVFLFFTVAKTKLLTYVLPMFPALGLLVGGAIYVLTRSDDYRLRALIDEERPLWILSGGLFLALQIIAVIAVLFMMDSVVPPEALHLFTNINHYVWILLMMTGTALALWQLSKKQVQAFAVMLSLTFAVAAGGLWMTVVPEVNKLTQGDMMTFVKRSGEAPLASYEITRPSLTYYTHRPIPHLAREDQNGLARFVALASLKQPVYLITKNKLMTDLIDHLPVQAEHHLIKQGVVYSMISIDALNRVAVPSSEAIEDPLDGDTLAEPLVLLNMESGETPESSTVSATLTAPMSVADLVQSDFNVEGSLPVSSSTSLPKSSSKLSSMSSTSLSTAPNKVATTNPSVLTSSKPVPSQPLQSTGTLNFSTNFSTQNKPPRRLPVTEATQTSLPKVSKTTAQEQQSEVLKDKLSPSFD